MKDTLTAEREAWAERRATRDEREDAVTKGLSAVTKETPRHILRRAYAVIVPLVLLAMTVNIFSTIYDLHRGGKTLPLWEPVSWEVSSAIAILVAALTIFAVSRLVPPTWKAGRLLAANILATLPFSALHTGGMVALRWLAYHAAGADYGFSRSDIFYEYRKDLFAYAVLYGAFRIAARPALVPPDREAPRQTEPADPIFTIIDGADTHRVPLSAILSLRAAGNYVEFHLDGGSRPLMRASLREMETQLAGHGFIRTHRSWLINAQRVRQVTSLGSGDYLLTLDSGDEAPLSRRFPEALASLRKKEGAAEATPSSERK